MDRHRQATVPSLFWSRVEASGARPAIRSKQGGAWRVRTWDELAADVARCARVLTACGVEAQQPVVQIAENRYEWLVMDLAIQHLRAIHVPIHPTLSGPQMAEQIRHCEAQVVCLSTDEIAARLTDGLPDLPRVLHWWTYDATSTALGDRAVQPLAPAMEQVGSTAEPQREPSRSSDIATILYTSGTTGQPKGVMLTQENLASNTLAVLEAMQHRPDDVRLAILPLSHIFARTCDAYTWLAVGCELAQAENRTTVLDDCQAIRPTVLNAVPYFFERILKVLHDRQDTSAEALRALLGGRIEHCCSGGAALPGYVFDFFAQRGIPILQGYGLTESSPVISVSSTSVYRRGAVGRPIPGIEVRLAEDGEILTRGPHVMAGYYKLPDETSSVLREGWLYTGDLGQFDSDGYLYITGRKKEMIITSAGKNVSPSHLETLLTADPLIHQVMLVGEQRPCLGALIVPDPDQLRAAIIARQIPVISRETALAHPQVRQLYADVLRQRLATRAHHEQVPLFHLVPRAFSPEMDEVTTKLTLRRDVIAANFAAEIDAMYAEGAARRAAEAPTKCDTKVTT